MAIFGRRPARRRPGRVAPERVATPTATVPVDCSAWVLGGLWPSELATVTAQTAMLAEYLNADLRRIAGSANSRLAAIDGAGLVGVERRVAERRVIDAARTFATLRVESTVRQLRRSPLTPPPAAASPAKPTPVARRPDAQRRLRELLEFVARQEPGLRWAVGARRGAAVLLVTDLAHGWIPPRVELPAGVRLLEPGRRDGDATALLGEVRGSVAYAPGDRLGWASGSGRIEPSQQPRALPAIGGIRRRMIAAVRGRAALSQVASVLTKSGSPGAGPADAGLDQLRVRVDTARYRLLAQYPQVDEVLLLNCMLLAAVEGIVTGDDVAANYHFAWYEALHGP
ncbi:MAG TPA: DUF5632 domain-containing protein [Mycobacterium sp.]|nr:DUF5632 domain-containing protein [Mycobacterium sp.]